MQTLFKKNQVLEERKETKSYEEWKKSKGTSVVKKSLKWTLLVIALWIFIDVANIVADDRFWTFKGVAEDNVRDIIFILLIGVFAAWSKNKEFRKRFNEESGNQSKEI